MRSKHPISTIIWGAIGYNFKSQLHFHHHSVDADAYLKCLFETQIFHDFDAKFGAGQYVFQQDGATCHTNQATFDEINMHAFCINGLQIRQIYLQ